MLCWIQARALGAFEDRALSEQATDGNLCQNTWLSYLTSQMAI